MAEAKTKPTAADVEAFINTQPDEARRADCRTLVALMERVTGRPATMWGTSIVGFDEYRYPLASGKVGNACVVGFSPRKGDLSIYLMAGYETPRVQAWLARLGKHKVGKACLYVKHLADVDVSVLEELLRHSVAETKRRYA
jgi:hypothetical protein